MLERFGSSGKLRRRVRVAVRHVAFFSVGLKSVLLYTVVGLKRTWDQKLSSGLTSGHLDVAFTESMLLTHMTIHPFQFSFADTEQYSLRPPTTLINWWPS